VRCCDEFWFSLLISSSDDHPSAFLVLRASKHEVFSPSVCGVVMIAKGSLSKARTANIKSKHATDETLLNLPIQEGAQVAGCLFVSLLDDYQRVAETLSLLLVFLKHTVDECNNKMSVMF
jgi:hypothetical protein